MTVTVTETLDLPSGATPSGITVRITLYGARPVGYAPSGAVVDELVVTPNASTGVWTTPLVPNDDITPAGTVYRVRLEGSNVSSRPRYISVPDTGGPYSVEDLLVDAPDAPASAPLAVHAALRGPGGHLPDGTPADGDTIVWDDAEEEFVYDAAAGGSVESIVPGTNIDVDATDPANPIVSVEALTSSDVGLGNVDNTSDANKPVSTLQAAADAAAQAAAEATAAAALTSHEADTTNVHGIADTSVLATDADIAALSATYEELAHVAASGMGFVFYGSNEATVRPTGYACVTWLGYDGFVPDNVVDNDIVRTYPEPDTTAPGVPTGLSATPGDTQVVLNWDDNAEPDLDHYDYRVDGGAPVSTGTTSGATVGSLTNGVEYDFEVRAVDGDGNASAWSAVVSSTPVSDFSPFDVGWHVAVWAGDVTIGGADPAEGATVAQWDDGSGNGRHLLQATETNKPTYRASSASMNNKPILEFRTDDSMEVAFAAITQPFHVVVVARYNTTASNTTLVGGNDSTHRGNIAIVTGPKWGYGAQGTNVDTGDAADTTRHLFRARFNGASSAMFLDGTEIHAGSAGTEVLDGLRLALNAGGSNYANVDVAFVAVFVGDVTADASWADFLAWVESEYAITIP